MALGGNKLHLHRQKLWVPVSEFTGVVPGLTVTKAAILSSGELGVSADSASATINNNTIAATLHLPNVVKMTSAGGTFATAATLEEISTSGLVGLKMNTAGQTVSHLMPVPNNWDRYRPVYVRVVWTSGSSTGADTIDWVVTYLLHTANAATALTSAEGALGTVIAQDTVAGAYALQETAAGQIASTALSNSANKWLKFTVENDAFAAGLSEDKFLLGVTFEYSPFLGPGLSQKEAPEAYFGQYS